MPPTLTGLFTLMALTGAAVACASAQVPAAVEACHGKPATGWLALDPCSQKRSFCIAIYAPANKAVRVRCETTRPSAGEMLATRTAPDPNWREHVKQFGERLCRSDEKAPLGWHRVVIDAANDGRSLQLREGESCAGQASSRTSCVASFVHGESLMGFVEVDCATQRVDVTYHEDLRD